MKRNSLTFDVCKVHCFLPEGYWWKQLLISLGISLLIGFILSLFK